MRLGPLRVAAAAAAAVAAGSALAAASGTPAASPACVGAGEEVMASNAEVVVVGRPDNSESSGKPSHSQVYGCFRSSGSRVEIEACACVTVDWIKLRGRFVVYEQAEETGEEFLRQLLVRDLDEDRRRYVDETESTGAFVGRAALRANGSIGYIRRRGGRWRVLKCEFASCYDAQGLGRPAVLDAKRGVDGRYLKLSGDRLRWRRDGKTRSAKLG